MNNIMLQLGDFQFAISTAAYNSLTKTYQWLWAETDRFGQMGTLQYTGKKLPKITLTGSIYPLLWEVGTEQVKKLEAEGDKATPLLLTSGLGEVLGYWCIERIVENQSEFTDDGQVKKQTFTLDIKYYAKKLSN